jgi:hypothetical protein
MATKTLTAEKEQRKVEAKKLKSWTYKNLALLVSGNVLQFSDMPGWLNCIRQARMLDDIHSLWLMTEVLIKSRDPDAKTACDEARYQQGLRSLIELSLSGRTNNTGGV